LTPVAKASSPVRITQITPAVPPLEPASPKVLLALLLGVVGGLAVGVLAALIRSASDTRVHSIHELEQAFDLPILGSIPFDSGASTQPLVVARAPQSSGAEAYRALRTTLRFLRGGVGPKVFVVTSSVESEGKSTTSANLSLALADAGQRVLLIEADLRRPKLAGYLGLVDGPGLTDVLIGGSSLEDAVQQWGDGGLRVLGAGQVPPNPSELLQSERAAQLLESVREGYDAIIIDAPPLLPVTDAAIVAKMSDGALVVAALNKARYPQLRTAIGVLDSVGARSLGLVLTMDRGADRYGYGYGYGTRSTA
jgi:capsular exopolysaccharide synthesis family protein